MAKCISKHFIVQTPGITHNTRNQHTDRKYNLNYHFKSKQKSTVEIVCPGSYFLDLGGYVSVYKNYDDKHQNVGYPQCRFISPLDDKDG